MCGGDGSIPTVPGGPDDQLSGVGSVSARVSVVLGVVVAVDGLMLHMGERQSEMC